MLIRSQDREFLINFNNSILINFNNSILINFNNSIVINIMDIEGRDSSRRHRKDLMDL